MPPGTRAAMFFTCQTRVGVTPEPDQRCARLYGKRAAKNRAKKAMEAMQCEPC
jgi:hypothetical protein